MSENKLFVIVTVIVINTELYQLIGSPELQINQVSLGSIMWSI